MLSAWTKRWPGPAGEPWGHRGPRWLLCSAEGLQRRGHTGAVRLWFVGFGPSLV